MKQIFAALIVIFSATAWAGDYEDGLAAYSRGDHATAFAKFEKAAHTGNFYAQFALITIHNRRNTWNPAEAKRWVNVVVAAAEKGDVDAQFVLGQLHSRGYMPYEPDEGLRWTVLAAQQGNIGAQILLGRAYGTGEVVPRNGSEAARWFKLAAEQGNSFAQYRYAASLEDWFHQKSMNRGWPQIGAPKDLVKPYMWTYLSTTAYSVGVEVCGDGFYGLSLYCIHRPIEGSWPLHLKSRLERLERQMTPQQVAEAKKLALQCKERDYRDCD